MTPPAERPPWRLTLATLWLAAFLAPPLFLAVQSLRPSESERPHDEATRRFREHARRGAQAFETRRDPALDDATRAALAKHAARELQASLRAFEELFTSGCCRPSPDDTNPELTHVDEEAAEVQRMLAELSAELSGL